MELNRSDNFHSAFPVGMWVWVREGFPDEPVSRRRYALEVFKRIRALGCDLVVIGAGGSDERIALMDQAHAAGLHAIISCGDVHTWIRTGTLDGSPVTVDRVVDPEVEKFSQHPALWMYFINDIPGPDHIERLAQATRRFKMLDAVHATYVPYNYMVVPYWQKARTPAVTWDNFPIVQGAPPGHLVNDSFNVGSSQGQALREIAAGTPGACHITLVQCWGYKEGVARQRIPTLPDLRQQTYLAMANGWTDGFVLYHYHSRVDPSRGGATRYSVFNLDGSLRIGSEAQLKAFISKARTMGLALAGCSIQEIRGVCLRWPLQGAGFQHGGRRFLLVISHDVINKCVQEIEVHSINGRDVGRLVDVVSGESFERHGETLRMTVDHEPADASLYEVFFR